MSDYLEGLKAELASYESAGLKDRAAAVAAEIDRVEKAAKERSASDKDEQSKSAAPKARHAPDSSKG